MMKLYSFPGSCALGSHIVLEWIDAPFSVELITKGDLSTPELQKLNPLRRVPILVDDGWVLTENAAILNYLADKHPEAKLGGGDTPRGRAEVNRWLGLLNSEIHPAFKPIFGATAYLQDKSIIAKTHDDARKRLRGLYELCNDRLGKHDWLAGDRSIADPYLFVTLRWAKAVNVDLSGLDHLVEFEGRMRADAGVQKALKDEGLDQPPSGGTGPLR